MSKSVLVIDTPENCDKCKIRAINLAWCNISRKSTSHHPSGKPMDERNRPDWCPIKPLPEKKDFWEEEHGGKFSEGWNACIDEITGDNYE